MRDVPDLGVGLGYREPYHFQIMSNHSDIDFLELIPENFISNERAAMKIAARYPIVLHCVNLSIGSEVKDSQLRWVSKLSADTSAKFVSEHVSFTRAGDLEIGHLTPLPFTEESVRTVVRNLKKLQEQIECPIIVENITYPFAWSHSTMSEGQFLTEILEDADVGLLLDVQNIFNNAVNHKYNAYEFIDSLPLRRLGQIHLAGGQWSGDRRLDTHNSRVEKEVWAIFEYIAKKVKIPCLTLEWDQDFPPFRVLLDELSYARQIIGELGRR